MKIKIIIGFALALMVAIFAVACGSENAPTGSGLKKISDKKVSETLTIALSNSEGKLKTGSQEVILSFTDGAGKPVDISAALLVFKMPAMGSMAEMNESVKLTTTSTVGEFKGSVNISMAGDWTAQISYEGQETGSTSMSVAAY